MLAAARIADGGDMIDVDAEADGEESGNGSGYSLLLGPILDFKIGNAPKFPLVVCD